MKSDEIKEKYSMPQVLERYGLRPSRGGFIRCPFHKEKTASMKIYKDSYYCFGCGAHGDVFDFVQQMEGLDFKAAFRELGGTYEHRSGKETFREKMARYHAEKEREMSRKKKEEWQRKKELNLVLIDVYRDWFLKSEPFSRAWTECYNALQYQLYLHGIFNGLEV